MSGGIFLLRGDDDLVEMRESPYEAEEVLQALIARFPSLLAGDQGPVLRGHPAPLAFGRPRGCAPR